VQKAILAAKYEELGRELLGVVIYCNLSLNCVGVLSLLSGKEINNPWGPKKGGPEGTGKGKVQSTPVPKRGTKVLRHKPEGARDPRHAWFSFWTRGGGRDLPLKAPEAAP